MQHGVAGDALQNRRGQRRRVDDVVAHEEQVLAAAFAEEAGLVERDAFGVAVDGRLHLDQTGVGVVGGRLGHGRERVRRNPRPRADADVDPFRQRIVARETRPTPTR